MKHRRASDRSSKATSAWSGALTRAAAAVWLLMLAALCDPTSSVVHAQALRVPVRVDACVPIDRDKFVYLLGIELGADSASEQLDQSAAIVTLSCVGDEIVLTVQDAITRKEVTRRVELMSVDPSARTRLLALTVAELVLASWMEVRMEPRPVIPPAGPPPPAAAKERVSEVVEPALLGAAPALRLGASLGAFFFLSAPAPVAFVALHLTQPLTSAWALHVNLQGGYGSLPGELRVDAAARAEAVRVRMIDAALLLSLRYTRSVGDFDLWAGLSGLLGLAYLTGTTRDPGVATTPAYAPWAGPGLQLAAAYRINRRMRVFMELQAGVLAVGASMLVQTNQMSPQANLPVAELRGGWGGASLGFDSTL